MNIDHNKNNWIGSEVITETGETLGWVKRTSDCEAGESPLFLFISILPSLWLPKFITGIYTLPAVEIASTGPERIITFERAEDQIVCQTVSWLERIGFIRPLWSQHNSQNNDSRFDDGGAGTSPVPVPRKPSPNPLMTEAPVPEE